MIFRIIAMLVTVFVMSSFATCFAMQFSQPVEIGSSVFSYNKGGGHNIEGATEIKASKYYNPYKKRFTGYDKGYATFDGGNLYIHYDSAKKNIVRIGASDKNNTVQAPAGNIFKIKTDQDITLYFLNGDYEGVGFSLVGKRADGRFVKYVDGDAIFQTYYGQRGAAYWHSFDVNKDNI